MTIEKKAIEQHFPLYLPVEVVNMFTSYRVVQSPGPVGRKRRRKETEKRRITKRNYVRFLPFVVGFCVCKATKLILTNIGPAVVTQNN